MRILSVFLLLPFLFFKTASYSPADADKVVGIWLTEKGNAKLQIYRAVNNKYYGKIVWLLHPNEPDGSVKLDKKNPDPKLRTRTKMGLVILRDFVYKDPLTWTDGIIYDPDSGSDYHCTMTLTGPNKLHVRGYIGIELFGRSEDWTRQ